MKAFYLFLNRWLPVALWAGLVLYASTSAGSVETSAKVFKPFLLWFFPDMPLMDARELNVILRKTAHVMQFFVFPLLIWRAVRLPPAWPVGKGSLSITIAASSAVIALASEGIQLFYIERGASLWDVGLDVGGALLGVGVIWIYDYLARPVEEQSGGIR